MPLVSLCGADDLSDDCPSGVDRPDQLIGVMVGAWSGNQTAVLDGVEDVAKLSTMKLKRSKLEDPAAAALSPLPATLTIIIDYVEISIQ